MSQQTIGPLISRSEDQFLNNILKEIRQVLSLPNEYLTFLVKYTYDKSQNKAFYSHLNADIFDETNTDHSKIKEEIVKTINDLKQDNYEFASTLTNSYRFDINISNNNYPINSFLTNIPQFPADFSQGYLGYFYPFCKITGQCYKNGSPSVCEINTKDNTNTRVEHLKKCGLWLGEIDSSFEDKSLFIKQKVNEKVNSKENLEYKILSSIENILFPFNHDKISIAIPLIRRGQCNSLMFIQVNNSSIITDELINKYTKKVSEFYDNEFYQSFFTHVENESDYAKILAKPEILSKVFNIVPTINMESYATREGIAVDFKENQFNIFFNGQEISFKTNTIEKFEEFKCELEDFLQHFIDTLEQVNKVKEAFYRKNLRTAIISILIDSYAHNISAHSLSALKWWFEMRSKVLTKRFYTGKEIFQPSTYLQPIFTNLLDDFRRRFNNILIKTKNNQENYPDSALSAELYYDTLGLFDSSYNKDYFSLFDFLISADYNDIQNLLTIKNEYKIHNAITSNKYNPRFPISLDYALFPLFKFLTDKGAFWSGITKDITFGGESKTLFKVLWEDFANNPLYLGTIASSEGVNKLNIFVAIKLENSNDSEWRTGHFVTIDLSVIDFELSDSKNEPLKGESESNSNVFISNSFCKICSFKEAKLNHSLYSLVRPGKCFKCIRETLECPDYLVYMPGGIIGEHSLFTIFENTLRNVKHFKSNELESIQKNGINFWISVENAGENFKISTWLGHENYLNPNKSSSEYNVLKRVIDNSLLSIYDDISGSPRMGGNSQDKACAAMLYNNDFISVENKNGLNYPWIKFSFANTSDYFTDYEIDESYYSANESSKNSCFNNFIKTSSLKEKGILKKNFLIWKGSDFIIIDKIQSLSNENVSRFKIVVIGQISNSNIEEKKDEIYNTLADAGVIRTLDLQTLDLNNRALDFDSLYLEWVHKWLGSDLIYATLRQNSPLAIVSLKKGNSAKYMNVKDSNIEVNKLYKTLKNNRNKNFKKIPDLELCHGSESQENKCNIRSHGAFWTHFFSHPNISTNSFSTEISVLNNPFKGSKSLLAELIETLATKIVIFDNRVYNKFCKIHKNKKKLFNRALNLEYYLENKEDFEKWKKKDCQLDSPLMLIIHLSFIESMGFSEENILMFIKNPDLGISDFFNKNNFRLIIVTGRGRSNWLNNIKENDKDKLFVGKILSKPIESIVNAVSAGLSYNDDFDVKFNLCKILFGS